MSYLYVDIETAPLGEPDYSEIEEVPVPECPEDLDPPRNYKDADKIAAWRAERYPAEVEKARQANEAARRKVFDRWLDGAKEAHTGRVVCIGVARDDGPVHVLHSLDEAEMLEQLGRGIAAGPCTYVTFNGSMRQGFDLPFLMRRAAAHSVRSVTAPLYKVMQAKPWERPCIDLRESWVLDDARGKGKQDQIMQTLGLEQAPDSITGADVPRLWHEGDVQTILDHCRADVEDLRRMHGRLEWLGMVPA